MMALLPLRLSSCPDLIRASIPSSTNRDRHGMDCRVKPGNDDADAFRYCDARTETAAMPAPIRHEPPTLFTTRTARGLLIKARAREATSA
jgi:hypothetical protein